PAMALRALGRVPYVLYIQDLWPDTVMESGMLAGSPGARRRVERVLDLACLRTYRSAERIVVISEGIRSILAERGVPDEKLLVVPNWVDESV
ncbi:glycosyltransferase, partial [Streptomyces caeruleatus]